MMYHVPLAARQKCLSSGRRHNLLALGHPRQYLTAERRNRFFYHHRNPPGSGMSPFVPHYLMMGRGYAWAVGGKLRAIATEF